MGTLAGQVVSVQVGHWCGKPGVGTVLSGVGRSRTRAHVPCVWDCYSKSGRGCGRQYILPLANLAGMETGGLSLRLPIPFHPILHHKAPLPPQQLSHVNTLTVILSMAPKRTALLATPKMRAISPRTLETFLHRHNDACGRSSCFPHLRTTLLIVLVKPMTSGRRSGLSSQAFRMAQRR